MNLAQILFKCCDNPDIHIEESLVYNDRVIKCFSCKEFLHVNGRLIGMESISIWNEKIRERDRCRRTIVKVGSINYPYVFAMK